MKLKFALVAFAFVTAFTSCQKDWAEGWVGTYTGTAGSAVNRVVVSRVDNKTLKMELQALYLGNYVTFATIASAKLSNATSASINEEGTIVGYTGNYQFSGGASRDGNNLTLTGQAQSKTNSSDIKYYPFTGSR